MPIVTLSHVSHDHTPHPLSSIFISTQSMTIPRLWLGTRKMTDPLSTPDLVAAALDMGYRHIDTAHIYSNHHLIKQGIQARWGNRQDLFLASKLWMNMYQDPLTNLQKICDELGTTLDLVYLHRPSTPADHDTVLSQAQTLISSWLTKSIGISNFPPREYIRLHTHYPWLITAHQYEAHALLDQSDNLIWCTTNAIQPVAYSPFAHGHLFAKQWTTHIDAWCKKNWPTHAQVYLGYLLHLGYAVLPKASSVERLRENLVSHDILLDDEILVILDRFPKTYRYCNPPFAQWE